MRDGQTFIADADTRPDPRPGHPDRVPERSAASAPRSTRGEITKGEVLTGAAVPRTSCRTFYIPGSAVKGGAGERRAPVRRTPTTTGRFAQGGAGMKFTRSRRRTRSARGVSDIMVEGGRGVRGRSRWTSSTAWPPTTSCGAAANGYENVRRRRERLRLPDPTSPTWWRKYFAEIGPVEPYLDGPHHHRRMTLSAPPVRRRGARLPGGLPWKAAAPAALSAAGSPTRRSSFNCCHCTWCQALSGSAFAPIAWIEGDRVGAPSAGMPEEARGFTRQGAVSARALRDSGADLRGVCGRAPGFRSRGPEPSAAPAALPPRALRTTNKTRFRV